MTPFRHSLLALSALTLLGLAACAKEPEQQPPVVVPVVVQTEPTASPTPAANTAQAIVLSAQLNGAGEVPAVVSDASGTLEASFAPATQVLSWTLNYSGLSGPLTGVHFHGPAMAGQNAGVVLPIGGPMNSPMTGSVTLNAAQVAEMSAGSWYVNLHTAAHPDGEIRGQLQIRP